MTEETPTVPPAPASVIEALVGIPAVDISRKTSPTFGKIILALSKAQASFEAIEKDKTVKVTTKTGGSYSFQYSTLDAIVKATKK